MGSRRNLVGSVLVAVLVALTPIAYASPPDPTYISGLWDDGDYDDVVILATTASSIIDFQTRYDLALVCLYLEVPPAGDVPIASRPLCRSSRAPPTA